MRTTGLTEAIWHLRRLARKLAGGGRSLLTRGIAGTWQHVHALVRNRRDVQQPAPALPPPTAPAPSGSEGRVLVVDAVMPDPARDSGSVRLLEMLQLLVDLDWQVSFMPDSGRTTPEEKARLARIGVETIGVAGSASLPHWLRSHASRLHAAILCRHPVARMQLPLIRALAPDARIIFDTVDLHFLRESREAEAAGDRRLHAAAERTRRTELSLMARSDVTLVVSPIEQELLSRLAPGIGVEIVSNIHHVQARTLGHAERADLLFVGGFGHPPNRDAAYWLVTTIFPRIRERLPDIRLHLVGSIPDQDRQQLQSPGVLVHGRVESLEPLLSQCRIAVAPLRVGAGVKGKVNTAMSHGLPVVMTAIAAEGMFIEDGRDALLADDAQSFADACVRLYQDAALWESLSVNGQRNVQEHFSADNAKSTLQRILPDSR
ncbi:glycosyltransferase family 4 protein [Flavobacterium sp. MXW15]|uniref:Glycosyltransferase family 4 protein n=1 Tax=Xanthomonas chitinilytica TaxID=2989819 RepID=A0ABT3JTI1_9XANT|nr:glycosyltransferase family 4 protein [Xanthomonas sp. H13-6]MCW4454282.1 glycosyltransferase family 4 protein [Flavobacterium sp. MXW15]MCW4471514.1 glycosyltransferase family 4 protein [Xanthomonas sp. H13-6]